MLNTPTVQSAYEHRRTQLRFARPLLVAAIVLAVLPWLSWTFVHDLDDLHQYNGDETLWIPVGHRTFDLFIRRDWDNPDWRDDFHTFGALNPQIGKYIIGLGTHLAGVGDLPIRPAYRWNKDLAWNLEHGGVHPPEIVAAARLPVAVSGIAASLLLLWLGALLFDIWHGLLALLLILRSSLLVELGRQATLDVPALAFSLLALIGLVYLSRALREGDPRAPLLGALTGLACGLAIGTKLNTLLLVGVGGVVLLVELLLAVRSGVGRGVPVVVSGALLLLCSVLVVWGSNPALYRDPIGGFRHLLFLNELLKYNPYQPTPTLAQKLPAVWASLEVLGPFPGRAHTYNRWLLLCGLIAMAISLARLGARGAWERYGILATWMVVGYAGIALWLPHDWSRYFLPLQPINALLGACGLLWLISLPIAALGRWTKFMNRRWTFDL